MAASGCHELMGVRRRSYACGSLMLALFGITRTNGCLYLYTVAQIVILTEVRMNFNGLTLIRVGAFSCRAVLQSIGTWPGDAILDGSSCWGETSLKRANSQFKLQMSIASELETVETWD